MTARTATAVIDSLAIGGSGVCRIDGKVCFVPYSCPGDEIRLEVVSDRRSFSQGRVLEIITPSRSRIVPRCPVAGRCGGCSWQHVEYSCQLAEKRRMFADALWRGGRVEGDRISGVVPSPLQYGYRGRIQFKLHWDGGRLQMGFYRTGSHYVIDAPDGCPVALPVINEAAGQLRRLLQQFPGRDRIPQVNVECGDEGAVAVVNYIGSDVGAVSRFLDEGRGMLPALSGFWLQTGRKSTMSRIWGDDRLCYGMPLEDGGEVSLAFAPGGFSQVNAVQNRQLLEVIRRMGAFRRGDAVLDLYCGNGNFSVPLAASAGEVTGVESYEGSIAMARANAARNRISAAEFVCCDAGEWVNSAADGGRHFDLVLLDPPRSGAAGVIDGIARLRPRSVIYVSCDPSTLARDCGILAGRGYRVAESVPVDMFPQTAHLESVTLFTTP